MTGKAQTVAVLGASNKQDRYSWRAISLLKEHGHDAIPIHPSLAEIDGMPVTPSLGQIDRAVDTLTLYVNAAVSARLSDEIIALKPGRVIFNPGTESSDLASLLEVNGIPFEEACTLVLLDTGQF